LFEPAVISIGIDPIIELGPISLAWHGLTISIGILAGGWFATRVARQHSLDPDRIWLLVVLIAVSGMIGARALFLLEDDPVALLAPSEWVGSRGFSFYGGIIAGVPAVVLYLCRNKLGVTYLDALAAGFPLGMAVGRIGDIINGEHYGPASDLPWAVQNTHPAADVPSNQLAYHSGGLYEVVLALAMIAALWALRERLRRPGAMLCAVVGMYAAGRFGMFFVRSDSTELTLGLSFSQWISLLLLAFAILGLALSHRRAAAVNPEAAS
jgi:phosphatidylglycerol---prolipoprotein diacylglyceryl transferase